MRQLFVYYRVRSADAPQALAAVHDLQARLRETHPGLLTQLMRRPEEQDGCQTWMETYAISPAEGSAEEAGSPRVDAALQARIEAAAEFLAPLLAGTRHVEIFDSLPAPSLPDDPAA